MLMLASSASLVGGLPYERAHQFIRSCAPFVLLAAIGVEFALLTALLPGTLDRFLHGPTADFHNLYEVARKRDVPGLYSPFLVVLLYPLAQLPEMTAFRAMFGINVAAIVAIALIGQANVRSLEAKTAVALAPLALPQMHWALRLGHLTPLVALTALAALLVLRHRPVRGAMMLAFLSIKPQYLIAPFMYLAVKREFRLLAIIVGTAAGLALAGFALIGPHGVPQFISLYVDWGPNSADNLLPVQQSWMVSWPGVQISLGREANPILTFDLILLSLAIAALAWVRTDSARGIAAAGLMMIPLTPYAQFYDAALICVPLALILRTNLPDLAKCGFFALIYLAAIVTQANVHFPAKDVLGNAHTYGFFWLTPVLVAATALLALASRPPRAEQTGGA
jgi:hypothetical protein